MSASDSRDDSFEVETNSPFYFNTSHWRAVDGMLEGVRERAGMMLLTGPAGSGKTMIMRAISEGLPEEAPALFLQYASLNFREFINFLHTSLHVEDEILDAPNKAVALREFLYVQAKRGETGVVFIDEAHNLEPDVLKMLPKLARFDTLDDGSIVGLQFVMIAGEDLREIMADSEYDEVRGKIAVDHTLRFFTREELKQFLKKRLAPIARMTDEPITEDGIEEMGRFTGGSPRLIGMICSHTMLFAAENPGRSIDAKMVSEAAEALMLSPVENPFASEGADAEAVTGLFSEADLAGDEPAPALPPQFSDMQTVYSTDAPDTSIMRDDASDHVTPPLRAEDATPPLRTGGATSPLEEDESLYSDDHEAMAEDDAPTTARSDDPDDAADDDDDDGFDYAAFDRALDGDGDDDGQDDDFGDDDDFDAPDTTAKKDAKPSVRKGGMAFLNRVGLRGGKLGWRRGKDEPAELVRTGRKRRKAAPAAAVPLRRGTKARVVGERERRIKMAGVALSALVVVGLAYAAVPPVVAAIGDVLTKPEQERVASIDAPALDAPALPHGKVAPDTAERRAPTTGGWGARVVMLDGKGEGAPGDGLDTGGVKGVLPIPGAATGAVTDALDFVDRAIGVGERNVGNDGMNGILAVASDRVSGLRDRVVRNGMTPEQLVEEVERMVKAGDAHFGEYRYIAPKGANAYDSYRKALALQPDNAAAKAGVAKLREHFAKKAEGARDAKQWASANSFFETAIAISNLRAVK